MTNEEALEDFRRFIDTKTTMRPSFFAKVVMALERQIPKELIKNDHGWLCPSCEAFFATYKGNFIDTNYCPNCGQRIDWSKDVEKEE